MLIEWPPAFDRQRVRAFRLEIGASKMQPRQSLAHGRAVAGIRPPDPKPVKKGDDRRRPAGDLAEHTAMRILHRLRTIDVARRQMLHQPQEEWQIAFGDALFIKRENEIAGAGMHQEIGILYAFSDALVGQQFADVVSRKKAGKIFRRNVGVDRHVSVTPPPRAPAAGGVAGKTPPPPSP